MVWCIEDLLWHLGFCSVRLRLFTIVPGALRKWGEGMQIYGEGGWPEKSGCFPRSKSAILGLCHKCHILKDMDMQKRREFVEETDCCFTCGTIGIHLPEPVTNPLQTKWHCATTCFNYQTCYIPSVRTTLTSILLKALNHSLNNFLSNTIKHISCLHGITVRTWNPTQHQPVIPFQRVFHDTNFLESIIHSNRQRSSNPAWFWAPSAGCVWSAPPVAAAPWHAVAPEAPDWRCRAWRGTAVPAPWATAPRVKETAWLSEETCGAWRSGKGIPWKSTKCK